MPINDKRTSNNRFCQPYQAYKENVTKDYNEHETY